MFIPRADIEIPCSLVYKLYHWNVRCNLHTSIRLIETLIISIKPILSHSELTTQVGRVWLHTFSKNENHLGLNFQSDQALTSDSRHPSSLKFWRTRRHNCVGAVKSMSSCSWSLSRSHTHLTPYGPWSKVLRLGNRVPFIGLYTVHTVHHFLLNFPPLLWCTHCCCGERHMVRISQYNHNHHLQWLPHDLISLFAVWSGQQGG